MMKAEGFVRFIRTTTFVVAALAAAAGPAAADGYITPYLGYNFGGDSANCATLTNCEEKHANFGVSLGSASGILGFEECARLVRIGDFQNEVAPDAEVLIAFAGQRRRRARHAVDSGRQALGVLAGEARSVSNRRHSARIS